MTTVAPIITIATLIITIVTLSGRVRPAVEGLFCNYPSTPLRVTIWVTMSLCVKMPLTATMSSVYIFKDAIY